jgi:hypothetical protein
MTTSSSTVSTISGLDDRHEHKDNKMKNKFNAAKKTPGLSALKTGITGRAILPAAVNNIF